MESILLVDDDVMHRTCLREILCLRGYTCIEAANGAIALEKLATERVSLIITDHQMPVMNGLQLVVHVSEDQTLNSIPVIIVTGETTELLSQKAIQSRVRAVLSKPYDLECLTGLVDRAFQNHTKPLLSETLA